MSASLTSGRLRIGQAANRGRTKGFVAGAVALALGMQELEFKDVQVDTPDDSNWSLVMDEDQQVELMDEAPEIVVDIPGVYGEVTRPCKHLEDEDRNEVTEEEERVEPEFDDDGEPKFIMSFTDAGFTDYEDDESFD